MRGRMAPLPEWISSGAIVGTQGGETKVAAYLDALLGAHPDTPVAALWLQDWVGTQTVPW